MSNNLHLLNEIVNSSAELPPETKSEGGGLGVVVAANI